MHNLFGKGKEKRTKSSHPTQPLFNKKEAENVKEKEIDFVNKAKEILGKNK